MISTSFLFNNKVSLYTARLTGRGIFIYGTMPILHTIYANVNCNGKWMMMKVDRYIQHGFIIHSSYIQGLPECKIRSRGKMIFREMTST